LYGTCFRVCVFVLGFCGSGSLGIPASVWGIAASCFAKATASRYIPSLIVGDLGDDQVPVDLDLRRLFWFGLLPTGWRFYSADRARLCEISNSPAVGRVDQPKRWPTDATSC